MQLAELNWGQLTYDWDDPRMVDFQNGLAVVNGAAERSPGFIWRMSDEDMEAVQLDLNGPFQGLPRIASMLSVWDDVVSLRNFVFQTIHKRFMDRKTEWYGPEMSGFLVFWWIEDGRRPTVAEGMGRWRLREAQGDTRHAFGWNALPK